MVSIADNDLALDSHLILALPKPYAETVDGSGNPIDQGTNIRSLINQQHQRPVLGPMEPLRHSEKDGGTTGSLPSGMSEEH